MAVAFSGTANTIQALSGVVTTYPVTMACWFYALDATGTYPLIALGTIDAGNDDSIRLLAAGGAAADPIRVESIANGSSAFAATSEGYNTGVWYHACGIVHANAYRTVFINAGATGASPTLRSVTGLQRTIIGGSYAGGVQQDTYFNGYIAEVGIWNNILTSGDIASLAKGYSPQFISPQNLVFYTPLVRNIIDLKGIVLFGTGDGVPGPRILGR